MKGKKKFYYSSAIKLPSAIGDWTQIKANDSDDEFFEVSEINYSNFDGISKEELKFVHFIHHKLASYITRHLSHDLNVKIELHTITATQLLYSDFIESISDHVFQANINFSDQGSVNILFGSKLAATVLDRLVGGDGEKSTKQSFNAFELELLNEQLQQLIPHFQKSWDNILDFSQAKMTLFSGKYRPDNHISYRGTTVVFTFYLFFGDGELLRLMVAYPSHLISNLIKKYHVKHREIKSLVKLDNKTIKGIDYRVIAELGTTKLSMNTIKDLAVGDIITLNKPIHSLIKLKIGDRVILTGQPCIYNDRLGCQIVLSKKLNSSVTLVHDTDMPVSDDVSVPVTLSVDSFVEDSTIDAVSDSDYSIGKPVVTSEELLDFMPDELVKEENNYSVQSMGSYQSDSDTASNFHEDDTDISSDASDDIAFDSTDDVVDTGTIDSDDDESDLSTDFSDTVGIDISEDVFDDTIEVEESDLAVEATDDIHDDVDLEMGDGDSEDEFLDSVTSDVSDKSDVNDQDNDNSDGEPLESIDDSTL